MTADSRLLVCRVCLEGFLPCNLKRHLERVHKKFEFICSRCAGDTSGFVAVVGDDELCMECAQRDAKKE